MGLAHQKRNAHIRNGRAGEDTPVGFLRQMGQNQILVVAVQNIQGAHRPKAQAAARLPGLQQQMHLGIVAQRLIVPHALHGVFNGFLVNDPPVLQRNVQAEALLHQASEYLQLYPAHDLHLDGIPLHQKMQLRVLFLQKPQLSEGRHRVHASGKPDPVGHYRLQQGAFSLRLRAQSLSRPGFRHSCHRGNLPGGQGLRRGKFLPRVGSQLIDFLLPKLPLPVPVGKQLPHPQGAPGDL